MANARINKWLDLLDRAGWTFIQTFGGTLVVFGFNDWKMNLGAAAVAAIGSALKTTVAQRTGDSGAGDLIPGKDVIE